MNTYKTRKLDFATYFYQIMISWTGGLTWKLFSIYLLKKVFGRVGIDTNYL